MYFRMVAIGCKFKYIGNKNSFARAGKTSGVGLDNMKVM